MLMRILFAIAALALVAILVTVGAMGWRLHRHLRRSNDALKDALADIHPEQEQVDKN